MRFEYKVIRRALAIVVT